MRLFRPHVTVLHRDSMQLHHWHRVLWFAALFVSVAPLHAQRVDSSRTVMADVALVGHGSLHLATAPLRWREDDLRAIAAAGVAIFALSSLDEAGRAMLRRNESSTLDDVATELERAGTVQNYYVLGALFVAGVAFDDTKARSTAAEGVASSLIAAGIITPTLQRLIGRSRPRKDHPSHTFHPMSGNLSFPSGHTTQAFAVASVIATEYDHPAVQVLAYGLATGVAASRMYHRAHFVSDVATAALIGTVVGRTVARYGQRQRGMLPVQPQIDVRGSTGLTVGFSIAH
jgi:membrane-associated phospholipid phosphatase